METRNSTAIHKILTGLKHKFVNKCPGSLPPSGKKYPVAVNADAPPVCKLQIPDYTINMNASTSY
jgi:hypothetical protein